MPCALILLGHVGGPECALPCPLGTSVASDVELLEAEIVPLGTIQECKVHCFFPGRGCSSDVSSRGRCRSFPLAGGGGVGARGDGGLLRFRAAMDIGVRGRRRRWPTASMFSSTGSCLHWVPRSLVEHNPAGTSKSGALVVMTQAGDGSLGILAEHVLDSWEERERTIDEELAASGPRCTSDSRYARHRSTKVAYHSGGGESAGGLICSPQRVWCEGGRPGERDNCSSLHTSHSRSSASAETWRFSLLVKPNRRLAGVFSACVGKFWP